MQRNPTKITLLYTSDVHGSALPILYGTNEANDLGLAKYATIVKETRAQNENVIVLDNGDLIQGTPLMTHYVKEHQDKENPMIGIMNKIGIDGAVIGNHEFNFGEKVLKDAVEQSNFPWLSANIQDEHTKEPAFGPQYIIKTFDNGIKVAIIGVTTHYIPNWESPEHIKGIDFADAFDTLQRSVQHIHDTEQPDVLIASYHGGFERDLDTGEPTEPLTGENQGYEMCQKIKGIDVLLTGHQHRVLNDKIADTLVIQVGKDAALYGEVNIELAYVNEKWSITGKQASIQTLKDVDSDMKILDYMESIETSTQKWLDQPIGFVEGNMFIDDPFKARMKMHPFVNFIQDVQMDVSGADISATSLFHNTSSGFTSVVTMRDVVSNYMYPNTLVVLELTGEDIIAAIEKSAAYFIIDHNGDIAINPTYITPKPQHYNYDMWKGIEYTINVGQPVGARVADVSYQGQPLGMNKIYHVVLNNYRASGGGDFDMFKGKPIINEIQKDTVEIIHAYFETHPTVQAKTTNNFIVKK